MPAKLPSPDERPNADVVIYDGNCQICTTQVSKLPWWDCQQLAYLSLHDLEVSERWPDLSQERLSHERLMQEMCIVDTRGNRYWGPEAIRYLTLRLRRLWDCGGRCRCSIFLAACFCGGPCIAGSRGIVID